MEAVSKITFLRNAGKITGASIYIPKKVLENTDFKFNEKERGVMIKTSEEGLSLRHIEVKNENLPNYKYLFEWKSLI